MDLTAGTRRGSYEIIAPLGAGGMGEVYRARDPELGREMALNLLPPSVSQNPERRARFEREARTLAALSHPAIVTIFAIEESDGTAFIVMELVESRTLSEVESAAGGCFC